MAVNEELSRFVRTSLERGVERAQVQGVLVEAGWPGDQVAGALGGFAEVEFPVPVPRPRPYLSAREAFIYLLLFGALYASAISLGTLVFQFIDRAFPDPTMDTARTLQVTGEAIRWSVAWLVVTLPLLVFVARANARALRENPLRRLSMVRRWLTYLTLFVGACILVGVLTTSVYNLLAGALTIRFLLQILTIGVITGGVFVYLVADVREDEGA